MTTKHRTGHLVKRGKTFSVQWRVDGKLFMKVLRDENGQPITEESKAKKAKDKFMSPMAVTDEAETLKAIAIKLEGRKGELEQISNEQNPPLKIVNAWGEYITSPKRPDSGDSTLRQYAFQFEKFADWMKKNHGQLQAMQNVTRTIAEDYAAHLFSSGLSASTFNKHLNLLSLVFRTLRDKAKLENNPWDDIQRKRISSQSRRELTFEELKKACQSATGELRTLLAVGLYSGLRLGDAATLRWGEVDLKRGVIMRIPFKTARRNPKPVSIPIHATLNAILAETTPEKRHDYVVPGIASQYMKRIDLVTDTIQNHFKACGIQVHKAETGKDGKRAVVEVGFHSLRHSFVSLCREANAPLAVVESIVGHSSPAMTRHYTHVGELAASTAVASLPSVIGNSQPAKHPARNDTLQKIRRILESMNKKNWTEKKKKALTLIPTIAIAK